MFILVTEVEYGWEGICGSKTRSRISQEIIRAGKAVKRQHIENDYPGRVRASRGVDVIHGLRDGMDAAVLASGGMVYKAIQAHEQLKEKGVRVQLVNISCLSELDSEAVLKAAQTGVIITYEDHHIKSGLGDLIANFLADRGLGIRFRKLGVTHYGSSGKPDELYRMQGLDVESLVRAVMEEIKKK